MPCEEEMAVPISDLSEIKEFKKIYPAAKHRASVDSPSVREANSRDDRDRSVLLKGESVLTSALSETRLNALFELESVEQSDVCPCSSENVCNKRQDDNSGNENVRNSVNNMPEEKDECLQEEKLAEALVFIERLKEENEELLNIKAGMDLRHKKVKEFNDHLMEKNRIFQYELIKTRAQILSLEKICKGFNIELNNLGKPVAARGIKINRIAKSEEGTGEGNVVRQASHFERI